MRRLVSRIVGLTFAAPICDASRSTPTGSPTTSTAASSCGSSRGFVIDVILKKARAWAHLDHFRRANADEILVTSRISSRLLARSSLYPGLAEIVTDIVSGGDGSELYRVSLPSHFIGLSVDELSTKLRGEHAATLLAIGRNGHAQVNPPTDFRLAQGDDAIVVAESLGTLAPLELQQD